MRGRREATQAQAPGLVPVKMDLTLKLKLIVIKFRNERRRIGSNCRRIDEILRGLGATIRMCEERMRSILLWSQNDPTLVTSWHGNPIIITRSSSDLMLYYLSVRKLVHVFQTTEIIFTQVYILCPTITRFAKIPKIIDPMKTIKSQSNNLTILQSHITIFQCYILLILQYSKVLKFDY